MAFFRRKKKKKKEQDPESTPEQAGQESGEESPEPNADADASEAPTEAAPEADESAAPSEEPEPEPAPEPPTEEPEPAATESEPAETAEAEPEIEQAELEADRDDAEADQDAGEDAESEETQEPADDSEPDEGAPRRGFFGRLAARLGRTREKLSDSIDSITRGREIDDELLDELEEVLVTADVGVATSMELIEKIRRKIRARELDDVEALKRALRQGIADVLRDVAEPPDRDRAPHVIMVVGVNGVGKTTTIAKLAHRFKAQGRKVLLAAGDTFRAAAGEQLEVWAGRVGCDIVRQQTGADPSAVAYDAVEAALSRGRDLVIIDTAGRLHTKVNLMEEMKKIQRVVDGRLAGAPHEVLLVLDATTGQNAVSQAKQFNAAVPLTGIVLTKLDGTAKGGVVVSITRELKLPILFVGLGEGMEDLRPFNADEFAEAVL